MTNREWLRSLTDNELAEIFCDNDLGNICNICVYRNDRKGCMDVVCCEDGVSEWLKQEMMLSNWENTQVCKNM